MGCSSGPDIIQDGLTFCVDAASVRSYPKSGTTWSDLKNRTDGTLTNTDNSNFSTDNGGVINLDATNEYLKIAGPKPTTNMSICLWFYPLPSNNSSWHKMLIFPYGSTSWISPYASYQMAVSNYGVGSSKIKASFAVDNNWRSNSAVDTDTIVFNRWYYAVGTFDLGVMKLYVNGVLKSTNDRSSAGTSVLYQSARTDVMLGTNAEYFIFESFNGGIAHVSIYDKTLTADEVRQNYLSTKERFA